MPHPGTLSEILEALESNARSIAESFSSIPAARFFDGDSDHWSPAHHLIHLTLASVSVERALRSGALPLHATGRSRAYAVVRDAATASLAATARERLLEMGRQVTVEPDATVAGVVQGFTAAGAGLRDAARGWTEEDLDRHALRHSLMGELTVREMLLFFVLHERHHAKRVRLLLESLPGSPTPPAR